MTELYKIENITRVFGDRKVLDIPELIIMPRKIYGLLGPNGAGKTTLMKILAFMDTPTTGRIWFNGSQVSPDQAARLRSRVVWVPQSPVMFTGSLAYNIEYPMKIKGVPRSERKKRINDLLELVNLSRLAKAPAHKLSGGEAQRASIARALAAGAEVILFDEPTASVDFRARGEIIELIRMLKDTKNLSLVVTTHDRGLATDLCSDFITLFDGEPMPAHSEAASLFRQGEVVFSAQAAEENGGIVFLVKPSSLIGDDSVAVVHGMDMAGGGVQLRLRTAEGITVHIGVDDAQVTQRIKELCLEQEVRLRVAG